MQKHCLVLFCMLKTESKKKVKKKSIQSIIQNMIFKKNLNLNFTPIDGVLNMLNRTRQCFCMNYIDHACRHQFLQNSSRFFRFLKDPTCAIFSKCRGFKDIKYDIPVFHECHEDITAYVHIPAFVCISLNFSAFIYISLNFSAFFCSLCISLHFEIRTMFTCGDVSSDHFT